MATQFQSFIVDFVKKINNNELSNKDLKNLLNLIKQILMSNDSFIYTSYKNNGELFDYNFRDKKFQEKELAMDMVLKTTALSGSYFWEKRSNYDYYIFQEVNGMMSFIIDELAKAKYMNRNGEYSVRDHEYHQQVMLYKYTFSILDKIINLVNNIMIKKNGIKQTTKKPDLNIFKDFIKVGNDFIKNTEAKKYLKEIFMKLDKSNAFHYLRKIRNALEHNFINPTIKKSYVYEINLLFLLVFYTYTNIILTMKSDDEIYDILNQTK